MVRYFFVWTPVVLVVGTLVLLSSYLLLIPLMFIALGVLAALAWAIVYVPYMLARAISRSWQGRSSASPRPAAALSPVRHA